MKAIKVVQIDCNDEADGFMLKEANDDEKDEETREGANKRKGSKGNDPLSWYGILTPQTLRNAQTNFTDALQVAVELADLKHKMMHCYQNYERLLQIKDKSKFSI